MFQQILGVKKFEHQILFNALMVRLLIYLMDANLNILLFISKARFSWWTSCSNSSWTRWSNAARHRNGAQQKVDAKICAQGNGIALHWRAEVVDKSSDGESWIAASVERVDGFQVQSWNEEKIQPQVSWKRLKGRQWSRLLDQQCCLAFHSNSAISIQRGFVEPFSTWFSPLINIKEISWTSQKCFATPKQKKIFYSFRNLISRFNLFVTLSFIDFQPITINLQFLYIFHRFSFSLLSQKKTWKTKILLQKIFR